MFEIIFYEDKRENSEVEDYIRKLHSEKDTSKDISIKFNKIIEYLGYLEKDGLRIGEPFIKHVEGEIWELRPIKDRFMLAYVKDNRFILLTHFVKQTQKTPPKEIRKAKAKLTEFLERSQKNYEEYR